MILRDLVHHGLEAFLELAAVLRAGDDRRHVERQDAMVSQGVRALAVRRCAGPGLRRSPSCPRPARRSAPGCSSCGARGFPSRARFPCARPIVGSSFASAASSVRSRQKWSSAGVLDFLSVLGAAAGGDEPAACGVAPPCCGISVPSRRSVSCARGIEVDARRPSAPVRRCPSPRAEGRAAGARCRHSCD